MVRSNKIKKMYLQSIGFFGSAWGGINSFVLHLNRVQAMISSFCLFIIMFLITGDVIGRFLFGKPIMGTYEISQMLMVFIVFFGLAHTQMSGGNVAVETIIRRFRPEARKLFSMFTAVVGLIVFSLMTYASWKLAWAAWVNKRTIQGLLGLPLYPSKFMVTLGTATLTLFFLLDLSRKIIDFFPADRTKEEGKNRHE